jgi:predicted outer membrane repeat protein
MLGPTRHFELGEAAMRCISLFAGALLLFAPVLSAEVYLVLPDGSGDFPTIQEAVDAAMDGDTIELGEGTFFGEGNWDVDFRGKAITIGSQAGNAARCVLDCQGSTGDVHRGFVFCTAENAGSVLSAVTVTHGRAELGGAVYCSGASPIISDCIFSANNATGSGGAVYCLQGTGATFARCKFLGNRATFGGGLTTQHADIVASDCVFRGNQADWAGGAVCSYNSSGATYLNCVFSGNTTTSGSTRTGGGMLCNDSPLVSGCTFTGNSAGRGGGLGTDPSGFPTISECLFSDNLAFEGGAVACYYHSAPTLEDCVFRRNRAALYGGAVHCAGEVSPPISGCTFRDNAAEHGGGINYAGGEHTLSGSSFIENEALGAGGAIRFHASSAEISGCTFAGNRAASGAGVSCREEGTYAFAQCTFHGNEAGYGGAIYLAQYAAATLNNTILAFSPVGAAVYSVVGASALLTCCDLYGNAGGDWVGGIAGQLGINGNICEDPCFCGSSDFGLQDCSPCAPFSPPNQECDLIGAWPVACGGTPAIPIRWGRIKALFRISP